MNIKECIKKNGLQIEVDTLKRCQTVDVSFINSDGIEDETEFDVSFVNTKAGEQELSQLFADFCKENHFKSNTVFAVTVVKSADTLDDLNNI